jgi:hypothetical protein
MLVRGLLAETLAGKEIWVVDTDPEVAGRFSAFGTGSFRGDFCREEDQLVEKFSAEYQNLV